MLGAIAADQFQAVEQGPIDGEPPHLGSGVGLTPLGLGPRGGHALAQRSVGIPLAEQVLGASTSASASPQAETSGSADVAARPGSRRRGSARR